MVSASGDHLIQVRRSITYVDTHASIVMKRLRQAGPRWDMAASMLPALPQPRGLTCRVQSPTAECVSRVCRSIGTPPSFDTKGHTCFNSSSLMTGTSASGAKCMVRYSLAPQAPLLVVGVSTTRPGTTSAEIAVVGETTGHVRSCFPHLFPLDSFDDPAACTRRAIGHDMSVAQLRAYPRSTHGEI